MRDKIMVGLGVASALVLGLTAALRAGVPDEVGGPCTAKTITRAAAKACGIDLPKQDFSSASGINPSGINAVFKLEEDTGKAAYDSFIADGKKYIYDLEFVRFANMKRPGRMDTGAVYKTKPTKPNEREVYFFVALTPGFKQSGKEYFALCYAFKDDEDNAYRGWLWLKK